MWIIGAMIAGVVLGNFTSIGSALDTSSIDNVSVPIALGLWFMMWPVLVNVRYELLGRMFRQRNLWSQVG